MVSRCIEALDRLEEISQQILKKSSMQEKIRKIERRLNHPKLRKKELICDKRKVEMVTVQDIDSEDYRKSRHKARVSFTRVVLKKDEIGKKTIAAENGASQNSISSQSRNCVNGPLENYQVSSKNMVSEPLSWEEQLNSEMVTIVEYKQRNPAKKAKSENDILPVVFHDKKWIEELLLNKQCRYQIPSFHLPEFQRKTEKKFSSTAKRSDTKRRGESLQNMMLAASPVSDNRTTSLDETNRSPVGEGSQETELRGLAVTSSATQLRDASAQRTLGNDRQNSQIDMIDNSISMISRDPCSTTAPRQHFDISVPNVDYIETIADDCQSLLSYAILPLDAVSLPEENLDSSDILKSQPGQVNDDYIKRTSSKNNKEMRNCRETDVAERKQFCLSRSAPHLSKEEVHKCPKRCSSRLVCTPSSTPLYFSDDVIEFPRSVSPVKKLLELRQTFCENMKKETEELQFDLAQLYLKKELHKR